jgi:nucleoside-diphosphate-sugar epimerase
MVLSYGMLLGARLRSKPPLLTPMAVRLLASRRTTSLDDARALLGYHPAVAYEEGVRRTGQWLAQNQYL